MELPKDGIRELMKNAVSVGDVYLLRMTEADGVTPKDGGNSRNKFFVVLGFDNKGNIYGGVVVNSSINQRMPQSITDCYMPISCKKYPFLQHDSFVNCANLKTKPMEGFIGAKRLGVIEDDDIVLIKATVVNSPNEKRARLKQFGLI